MPYLPKLIPEESKVLPEYFNNSSRIGGNSQQKSNPLLWLIAIFCFIAAVAMIDRLFVAVVLASVGLICTPIGKSWLEDVGQFKLTPKIRVLFCSLLLLINFPLSIYYQHVEEVNVKLEKERIETAKRYTADSLKQEANRKDSLHYYLTKIRLSELKSGLTSLTFADKYASSPSEKDTIKEVKESLTIKLVESLISSSKHQEALNLIQDLLKDDPTKPKLLYERAVCYIKLRKVQLAVDDLNSAKENGFEKAEKLYEKVNPLRKRVAYYITLCADGSTSSATGRGACSWHGGVAEWNHPVYEEYRKY
jgi:tetratricopeptide (TPR) repeat protein